MFKILLVDDEKSERTGIRFLIDKFNLPLSVSEAANGMAALEHVRTRPVDILFTDIKMPLMDGLELAKAVQEYDNSIIIVIFSAYGEFEYARKAMDAHAVSYLLKPIEVDEFEKTMREAVARCERQRAYHEAEQQRRLLDDAHMFFLILSGTHNNPRGKLPESIAGAAWYALINIETRNSLFSSQEEAFLCLVKNSCPCRFTYVNLYPNAAYLVLRSDVSFREAKLEDFAGKLHRDIVQVLKESGSLLIGPGFTDYAMLPEQASRLNRLRASIFEGDQSILFAEKLNFAGEYDTESIEGCREMVLEAIAAGDDDNTALQLQRLAKGLASSRALSVIYLHHILYDLIVRLYRSHGITDKVFVSAHIEDAVENADKGTLGLWFQDTMSKLANMPHNDARNSISARVTRIIETEYGNDIGLDYIAEKVHLSSAYLSFLYKRETGSNIIQQLTDYRMKKAGELLAGGHLKISDVANKCGYENPSYFNRMFKNIYGVTPKQYRETRP